jgi:hypothetical protein
MTVHANTQPLDTLFPDRHAIAEVLNLHPDMRASFVPFYDDMTPEQIAVHFPGAAQVTQQLVQAVRQQQAQPEGTPSATLR